ncbi:MAG: hypothetical protein AABX29_05895, partial [Nanoarchaeota archaeon]
MAKSKSFFNNPIFWIVLIVVILVIILILYFGVFTGYSVFNRPTAAKSNPISDLTSHFLFSQRDIVYKPLFIKRADGTTLKVAVWSPMPLNTRRPLIVFSHGSSMCPYFLPDVILYLVKEKGYMVAAPDHEDRIKVCSMNNLGTINIRTLVSAISSGSTSKLNFSAPAPTAQEFLAPICKNNSGVVDCDYRLDDIELVINKMIELDKVNRIPLFSRIGKIDTNKIAVAGYSLGGWAALGVAGASATHKDSRIKAVVDLDGVSIKYPTPSIFTADDLSRIDVPVMLVASDNVAYPSFFQEDEKPYIFYSWINSKKYYIGMKDYSHISFTSLNCFMGQTMPGCNQTKEKNDVVNRYVSAFLDKYLKNSQ